MLQVLQNAMRLQAARMAAQSVTQSYATVTGYDPDSYTATVKLADGTLSGWLPIASIWIGNLLGLYAPPIIDQLVTVTYMDGDINSGVVQGYWFTSTEKPLSVPSGEFWLVHASGAYFKLTNDKKLTLFAGNAQIQFDGQGNITSTGPWTHKGTFTATGVIHSNADVTGGGNSVSLVNHTHPVPGIQTGSSTVQTQAPNP